MKEHSTGITTISVQMVEEMRELLRLKRDLRNHGSGDFADQAAMASIDAREMLLLEELSRLADACEH